MCLVPQEDEKFLTEVFAQLTDEATDDSKRRELVSPVCWSGKESLLADSEINFSLSSALMTL